MTSTRHTGVVVSLADAETFQAEIRDIMAARHLNFGPAVDWYIVQREQARQRAAVDTSGWDAA